MTEDYHTKSAKKCSACQKTLYLGVEVLIVQNAVVGPRGVIALPEKEYFCSEKCVRDYFDASEVPNFPARVP